MAHPHAGLRAYQAKRNFSITAEPRGSRTKTSGPLKFVVQKHHARRLHYDFRLELEGTLKSWAVPKGPSLDPADKRLAVHVEDHPVEYGTFEGTIPPKQYGAGEVVLWDRGTWVPQGDPRSAYRAGKLKFELRGEKLQGNWTLVRTRLKGSSDKEQWLLIKERDEQARSRDEYDITVAEPGSVNSRSAKSRSRAGFRAGKDRTPEGVDAGARKEATKLTAARRAAMPARLTPQLATLVQAPPAGQWSYELKFDGYRILARISKDRARLFTRNGHDWTDKLAAQAKALEQLGLGDCWLDGEIVVTGNRGVPDFQALQNAFDEQRAADIHYFIFDLPWHGGYDLRRSPLAERRAMLRRLLPQNSGLLHYSEDISAAPEEALSAACRMGMEGVIGKRRDAAYSAGRSKSWIKLKCENRQEFVIGGFTDPQRSRTGFGALLLGVYENGKLRYAGRTGTGFDDKQLAQLHKQLDALQTAKPAFESPPSGADARGVHWVRPELVAEVSFAQWTKERVVRQAVFHGLRTDKPASMIGYEKAAAVPRGGRPEGGNRKSGRGGPRLPKARAKAAKPRQALVADVAISHPDRVIDAASGMTKLDVAIYYEKIAPAILPHLKDRPVSLVRLPEGLSGEQFFQKHLRKEAIAEVRLLARRLDPGHPPLIAIETPTALAGAAQMGVIELHTWNAVAASIERPDRIVLDLDPDPALPWTKVLEAAELTKTLLEELGVKSFAKTSGGKGLHIVAPLARRHDWEMAKEFSRAVATHLAATLPGYFSAKPGPANRVGKVFVDYLRNNRGSTTVSAFSLRARPGLPVSVPVTWEELFDIKQPDRWNITNIHQRLARLAEDPWQDYEKSRQTLQQAAAALGKGRRKVKGESN